MLAVLFSLPSLLRMLLLLPLLLRLLLLWRRVGLTRSRLLLLLRLQLLGLQRRWRLLLRRRLPSIPCLLLLGGTLLCPAAATCCRVLLLLLRRRWRRAVSNLFTHHGNIVRIRKTLLHFKGLLLLRPQALHGAVAVCRRPSSAAQIGAVAVAAALGGKESAGRALHLSKLLAGCCTAG
jgi:hypothetical protein